MSSVPRVAPLIGLALLSLLAPSAASTPMTPLVIEADVVTIDLDRERTEASGSASLSCRDLTLRADHLVADRQTGKVEAGQGLALVQRGRELQGKSLEYDLRTQEGVLTGARVAEQGVIIQGEKVQFSATSIVAHQAYFTTCDHPSPHYRFGADQITLTAAQPAPDGAVRSGRLTLDKARVTYHRRRLFTVPRYSVMVGDLGRRDATPLPVTGFSRDDGPYASMSYSLGKPTGAAPPLADLNYRYTTFRGIRGHLLLRRPLGRFELTAGYTRREDSSDRELPADSLEASLANVLVNRAPEYGLRLPQLALGRALSLRAEWLRGRYSECLPFEVEKRASADRASTSIWVTANPYPISPNVTLSHAVAWRASSYSPGDRFTTAFWRHSANLDLGPDLQLSLAHIARRGSGQTPFLFDQLGPGRELLGELTWRANPTWRLHLTELYDLERKAARDIEFEATRTAHCLEYTVGWRKQRGSFYVAVGLAPPSPEEQQP